MKHRHLRLNKQRRHMLARLGLRCVKPGNMAQHAKAARRRQERGRGYAS